MSPLTAPPTRGYPDEQRIDNYDTPSLFTNSGGALLTGDTMPLQDVSRFAYLGGYDFVTTAGQVLVQLAWFSDSGALFQAGAREFVLSQGPGVAQYRIPNQGAFVTITWSPLAVGNFHHFCNIIATNRYSPLEFLPPQQMLRYDLAQPIGAASNKQVFMQGYYAGPVQCVVTPTNAGITFQAQAYDPAGNIILLVPPVTPAAGVSTSMNFTAPPGAWWIEVVNSGAANSYYIACTPSMTGSS